MDLLGKQDLKLGSFFTGMRKRVQLARTPGAHDSVHRHARGAFRVPAIHRGHYCTVRWVLSGVMMVQSPLWILTIVLLTPVVSVVDPVVFNRPGSEL